LCVCVYVCVRMCVCVCVCVRVCVCTGMRSQYIENVTSKHYSAFANRWDPQQIEKWNLLRKILDECSDRVSRQRLREQQEESTCSLSGVLWDQGTRTGNTKGMVVFSHPARPPKAKIASVAKKDWDIVAHRKACLLENSDQNFRGFIGGLLSSYTCFQTDKRWRFDKSKFLESNSSQMYVCHVCHDVCGVCGEDRQVGHGEESQVVDLNQLSVQPPPPRCPPLWVYQIRPVRRRLVGIEWLRLVGSFK